jgi:hypothetical protein
MGALGSYNGFPGSLRSASYGWMVAEIRAGRVKPPSCCQACAETRGRIDYHTEDYSKPFGPHIYEFELCFRCHMMLHLRFRQPAQWERYIKALAIGAVYEPLMHGGEIGKLNNSRWIDNPVDWTQPRTTSLDFFRSLTMERIGPRDQPSLFE